MSEQDPKYTNNFTLPTVPYPEDKFGKTCYYSYEVPDPVKNVVTAVIATLPEVKAGWYQVSISFELDGHGLMKNLDSYRVLNLGDVSRDERDKLKQVLLHSAHSELCEAIREVIRISDRKHDAWDRVKDLIGGYDGQNNG